MTNTSMATADPGFTANQTAWVVGGAGYLGSPIVAALDARGVKTLCVDLPGKADELIRKQSLRNTTAVSLDVTDLAALLPKVTELLAQNGAPDGLVLLTTASSSGKTLEQLPTTDFSATLTRTLTPNFEFARAVALKMAERGSGSVVFFSSMYGVVSPDPRIYHQPMAPNPVDYGTAKAGILQMMRYFAVHYGPRGVRFNAITPGPFPNPNVQRTEPAFIERLSGKTALGRIGQAEEIVGPTLFLLGRESSFVTGLSLTVDGGWMAW